MEHMLNVSTYLVVSLFHIIIKIKTFCGRFKNVKYKNWQETDDLWSMGNS